jgi:hypothetical protein
VIILAAMQQNAYALEVPRRSSTPPRNRADGTRADHKIVLAAVPELVLTTSSVCSSRSSAHSLAALPY